MMSMWTDGKVDIMLSGAAARAAASRSTARSHAVRQAVRHPTTAIMSHNPLCRLRLATVTPFRDRSVISARKQSVTARSSRCSAGGS